jgi:uncharacterized protein YacL
MLITFLRILFVSLAVIIGLTSGRQVYSTVWPDSPGWFGGVMGFAIAITLIAAEQAFRARFSRSLVAVLLGVTGGLILSMLVLLVLGMALQNNPLYANLDMPVVLVTTYLVVITVVRNADRLRVIVPFVEFRAERRGGGTLILAADLLGDSRLAGLLRSGLFADRVIVHRRIVAHWESLTSANDPAQAARARRAVEGLSELRSLPGITIDLDDTEIPDPADLIDLAIRLARLETGRVATGDRDTARRATAQGLPVVDLAALTAALSTAVRPGDTVQVLISKNGDSKGQGVGFLDDGSMVIVSGAADRIGQTVSCTVLRLHTTHTGRMVFAELS